MIYVNYGKILRGGDVVRVELARDLPSGPDLHTSPTVWMREVRSNALLGLTVRLAGEQFEVMRSRLVLDGESGIELLLSRPRADAQSVGP